MYVHDYSGHLFALSWFLRLFRRINTDWMFAFCRSYFMLDEYQMIFDCLFLVFMDIRHSFNLSNNYDFSFRFISIENSKWTCISNAFIHSRELSRSIGSISIDDLGSHRYHHVWCKILHFFLLSIKQKAKFDYV